MAQFYLQWQFVKIIFQFHHFAELQYLNYSLFKYTKASKRVWPFKISQKYINFLKFP